jgi:class 3 adenylate cyclase/tetratricopeptide (TPR) repeat protein
MLEALPPPAPKQLTGERRIATVILADVFSSTDLLERIGTEAWVESMNQIFQLLETEIYRFGGKIDQFRGDGLVAFFGAAEAHEDDPERAVLAGLSMQRAMQRYSGELVKHLGVEVKLRVGVNTGEVIVTSIGDRRQHQEDTAMGEAIAIAARMETAAEPGTVLVSSATYQLVEDRFIWESLGEIQVKGVSTPISVYRPMEHLSTLNTERLSPEFRFTSAFTGRKTEFQLINRCIEDLYGGSGGITIVSGETGLGKSFLVTRVREYFKREEMLRAEAQETHPAVQASHPNLNWLIGNCRSYDQAWPYSVWLDMLGNWLNVRPDEAREEIAARLYRQSEALWGQSLLEYYPYLATFLSLPLEEAYQERVRHLSAESLQNQFRQAIRSWVEKLVSQGPSVFVFNDVNWADASALDLLRYCLPMCDNQALLFILTMRPDRTGFAWELRHHIETEYPHRLIAIDLQPLSETEICELLENVIGCAELSVETRQLVIRKSDGNPYYVQELVRALINQGVLVRDSETGRYRETRSVTTIDLPDSLQNLVLARIDRTAPEERRVLQIAAVIGQVFWRSVMDAVVGETNRLKSSLTALLRSDLISERSQFPILGMEYEFNSALIREVAYESLLSAQRLEYHRKVATYLESCTGLDGWAQYYSLVAYHYRCSGDRRKELFYTLQAAEQALKIYANAEAYQDYSNALNLLDQLEAESVNEDQRYIILSQRFEVLKGRGTVSAIMGNLEESQVDMHALLPLARQMKDDPAWNIDALLIQPEVVHPDTQGALQSGLEMAREALGLSQQIGDLDRELKSLNALSRLQFMARDPERYQVTERALELARQLGNRSTEVDLLLALGSASGMDNLEKQQTYLEAALSICYELEDHKKEITLLHAIGEQFERSGDYYRQLRDYEEQRLRISQEIGDRLEEAHSLMYCGQIKGIYLGNYAEGLPLVQKSAHIWERINDRLYPLLRQAQMYIELRRFKEALQILESIKSSVEQSISDVSRAGYSAVWGIYHNALGGKENYQYALESLGYVNQLANQNLVSRQYHIVAACQSVVTHLGLAAGVVDENEVRYRYNLALEASQEAVDLYQRFTFVRVAECVSEEVLYRHSQALEVNGRTAEAVNFLEKAYGEMMRKYALIPEDSPYRKSYLENICLHREIRAKFEKKPG